MEIATALEDLRRRLRQLAESQDAGKWIIMRKKRQVDDKIDSMIADNNLTTIDINGLVLKDSGLVELALWGKMHPTVASRIHTIDVGRNLSGGKGLCVLAMSLLVSYKNCHRVIVGGGNWCGWSQGVLRISTALRKNNGGSIEIRCRGDYEVFNIAAKLQGLPPGPRISVNVDCWPAVTKRGASALQTEALAMNDVSCTVNAPGVINKGYVMVPPIPEGNSCSAEFIEVCGLKSDFDIQQVADFISITNASKIKFRKQPSIQVLLAAFSNSCITDLEVQATKYLVDLRQFGICGNHINRVTCSAFDDNLLLIFPKLIQVVCNSGNEMRHEIVLSSEMALRTIVYHNGYNLLKSGLELATEADVYECNNKALSLIQKNNNKEPDPLSEGSLKITTPTQFRNLQQKLDYDLEYGTTNAGLRIKELRILLLCWKRVLSSCSRSSLNQLVGFGFMEPFGALIKKPKTVVLNFIVKLPMGGAPSVTQLCKNSPFSVGSWSTIERAMRHKKLREESAKSYSRWMTTEGSEESSITPECVVVEDKKYIIGHDHVSVSRSLSPLEDIPSASVHRVAVFDSSSCGIYKQHSSAASNCSNFTLIRAGYTHDTLSLPVQVANIQSKNASVGGRNLLDEVDILKKSFDSLRTRNRIPDELFLVVEIRAKLIIDRKTTAQRFHISFTIQTGRFGTSKSTCAELAKQYKRSLPRDHRKCTVVIVKPKKLIE